LATFIDALLILESLEDIPIFHAWVVGGDAREQAFLKRLPLHHAGLAGLHRQGRWISWGRVETTSLAELYARSTVTVVPSTFEQFGLVAIEAMACGCPVVATRTGGLEEIVVPGLTGEVFPVDDAAALANILTGYLRNPQKACWQGANAQIWAARYDVRIVYDQLYALVADSRATVPPLAAKNIEAVWRNLAIENARTDLEALIGARLHEVGNISDRSQTSARLECDNGRLYAKIISPRPHTLTVILPMPEVMRPPVHPREIVARYRLFEGSGLTPPLIASSDEGLIVTEWCPGAEIKAGDQVQSVWAAFNGGFARFGEGVADPQALATYQSALVTFAAKPSSETLCTVDIASAWLNAALTGGTRRFHRTHPQVELYRLLYVLERHLWALPAQLAERLRSTASVLLERQAFVICPPALCHGSLKPAHILRHGSRMVACDLDNAVFAVGPLDIIHWLYSGGRLAGEASFPDAAITLRGLFEDDDSFRLALAWLAVYVTYRVLDRCVRGNPDDAVRYAAYLAGVYEATFSSGIIR